MTLAEPIVDFKTGEIIVDSGVRIDREVMARLEALKIKEVWVQTESGPVKVVGNGLVDTEVKNITPEDMVATINYFSVCLKTLVQPMISITWATGD